MLTKAHVNLNYSKYSSSANVQDVAGTTTSEFQINSSSPPSLDSDLAIPDHTFR
jgi:hypothetical protein